MSKNKNYYTLHVLRTFTTLVPHVNNEPVGAMSFCLLMGEDGQVYRVIHTFTDVQNTNFLHKEDDLYPFMRDGDELKAVIHDSNVVEIVENLTLKKEMANILSIKSK